MRYKFGKQLSHHLPRPEVAGELPDLEPDVAVEEVRPGDNPGEIHFDVAFSFPPHDPSAVNVPKEVHAIHYPQGHGIPTDPELAIAASQPKASGLPGDMSAGGKHVVTIKGGKAGLSQTVTVLGYVDATPTADPAATPAPTDPAAAPTAS